MNNNESIHKTFVNGFTSLPGQIDVKYQNILRVFLKIKTIIFRLLWCHISAFGTQIRCWIFIRIVSFCRLLIIYCCKYSWERWKGTECYYWTDREWGMPVRLTSFVPCYRVVLVHERTAKPTEERLIYNKLTWVFRAYLARSTLRRKAEKAFFRVSPIFSVVALFENSISFSRPLSCRFLNFCLPGTLNSSSFLRKTNVRFKFRALGRLELSSFAMMV